MLRSPRLASDTKEVRAGAGVFADDRRVTHPIRNEAFFNTVFSFREFNIF
jgi:hypothetical protein